MQPKVVDRADGRAARAAACTAIVATEPGLGEVLDMAVSRWIQIVTAALPP